MATTDLRVLHVVTSPLLRGAQRFAVDLASAMAALGADVSLVALMPGDGSRQADIEVLGTSRWSPAMLRSLRARARASDVVIAHGSATLNACALATALTGTPFIYRLIGDPRYWTSSPARRARVGAALHRAASVVTYFPEAEEEMRRRYHIDDNLVTSIPKGVDLTAWPEPTTAERDCARRALDLPADATVIGFVGALSAEKQPFEAIEAAMSIPEALLLMVGDGPMRSSVESAALRYPGRILVLGALARPREIYLACDVILSTSVTEGVPGVLIEAGLCGVAAVASSVGGVGQVIVDGRNGIIVEEMSIAGFAAALDKALVDRDRMGIAARELAVSGFDITPVATRWLELAGQTVRTARRRLA